MSRAKDTKIIGTSQKFFGITLVAGLLVGVVFFVVMFLLAIKEPSKQTAGATTPGQTQVVPHPQWYLTWQKLPGQRGQQSGRFLVRLDRKDTILIVSEINGVFVVTGDRQSDDSYSGTWKDSQGRKGSFENLLFEVNGKSARGWSIGDENDKALLTLSIAEK